MTDLLQLKSESLLTQCKTNMKHLDQQRLNLKINSIKAAITKGSYNIHPKEIAKRILMEQLLFK